MVNVANDKQVKGDKAVTMLDDLRKAFEVFDSQSKMLKVSYDTLSGELDVTNRKLISKNMELSGKVLELQEMSSRMQCIIESLTDSVLVVNTHLNVERHNIVAERLFGRSSAEISGKPYREIANGLGDEEMLSNVINDGDSFVDVERVGADTIVLASVSPILSPDGSIIGAVEVLRDVTHMRALESKFECHKRMIALGQMAASVAHEIRNPLGTIEGFARLLKRDLEDQPQHRRLASKIVEGAQNLNYVITNLLNYARPMMIQCEVFQPGRLLTESSDVLQTRASELGVALQITDNCPDVDVHGDSRQLRQVLINLALNAIEACERGGHVEVSLLKRDKTWLLRVKDDGCGISESDIGSIFDPFFTKKAGGTGLGLALCHKIVSAHGGEIIVASKPAQGSVFDVVLPLPPAGARHGKNRAGEAAVAENKAVPERRKNDDKHRISACGR